MRTIYSSVFTFSFFFSFLSKKYLYSVLPIAVGHFDRSIKHFIIYTLKYIQRILQRKFLFILIFINLLNKTLLYVSSIIRSRKIISIYIEETWKRSGFTLEERTKRL